MANENDGKTVTISSIKRHQGYVKVSFLNHPEMHLMIATNIYLDHLLYEGKVITNEEYEAIKNEDKIADILEQKTYELEDRPKSEKEVRFSLFKKGLSPEDIDYTIHLLQLRDRVNDYRLAREFQQEYQRRLVGKHKVIIKLRDRGFPHDIIVGLDFDEEEERKRAKEYMKILSLKFQEYPIETKKQKVYQGLVRKGYHFDLAHELVKKLDYDDED